MPIKLEGQSVELINKFNEVLYTYSLTKTNNFYRFSLVVMDGNPVIVVNGKQRLHNIHRVRVSQYRDSKRSVKTYMIYVTGFDKGRFVARTNLWI